MTQALAETRGFRLPCPVFSEPASLKAEAEFALGLTQDAQRSWETALQHTFTETAGYTPELKAVVPLLATHTINIDKAHEYYQFAKGKKIPEALDIMENLAVNLARQDKTEAAQQLADEFFPKDQPITPTNNAKAYQDADSHYRGNYLLALAAHAEVNIEQGDLSAARETLNFIETQSPDYSKDSDIAIKVALIYAKLGEADKTIAAINSIYEINYYKQLTEIAIRLCKAGQTAASTDIAEKRIRNAKIDSHSASEKEPAHTTTLAARYPEVVASLAQIELSCGDAEKAKTSFTEVLNSVDKAFPCHSDFCDNPFATSLRVRQIALDAGLLDKVWETKDYDDPIFSLNVALQRANSGDALGGLARLDELGPNPPEHWDAQYYLLWYPLVKAQILAKLGKHSEATTEILKARRSALHANSCQAIAFGLLEIAKAYLELKQPEQAVATIEEITANCGDRRGIYPALVAVLAKAGADQKADSLTLSLLESYPNSYLAAINNERSRSRIMAELALSQFRQTGEIPPLADLKQVHLVWQRLALWLNARKIADNLNNTEAKEFINGALSNEVGDLGNAFNTIMNNQEKRQIIHDVAHILRADLLHLPPKKQLVTLTTLSEQARFQSEFKEGRQALCELGYTAHKLNQAALAKSLFDEGITPLPNHQADASVLGACAFWLKVAGDPTQAKALADRLVKQLPNQLAGHYGYIHTLQDVATAYAEYEKGEIQWLDGSLLTP